MTRLNTVGELSDEPQELVVSPEEVGQRLDVYLATKFPLYSRVHLRRVISAGGVTVEGHGGKPSHKIRAGETISIRLPELPRSSPIPEEIPLTVIYEDEHLVAINKPPQMVVHPSRGHWSGTLTSALAFHFNNLSSIGGANRPGIVHRLDRDTTGVIVVAKSDRAHAGLTEQFESRTTEKEYFAICAGNIDRDRDQIDLPIGPHAQHREKMAIRPGHPLAKEAQTFYEVIERFDGFTAVRVLPKTGRTHQIRVHMAHVGTPVLCDKMYGSRAHITQGEIRHRREDDVVLLARQALHARRLKLAHPITGEMLEFIAEIPADIQGVLDELRAWRAKK